MFPLPRGAVLPLLFLICAVLYINGVQSEGRVVCYYTNWSVYRPGTAKYNPQNINPYLCTHLIYAFGGFTKDNQMKPFDKYQDIEQGGYAKFTGLKTYNKQLKTMIAIGGWNEASTRFSPLVANPERRQKFIKNILKFLRQNHFDGIDLDWEYPAHREGGRPQDRENYAQFVQELRAEFERESEKTGRTRLLITMAVPAGIEYIEKGYDIPKLNKYLDWFNLLSYDFHASTEPSVNHHAPLYSLEEDSEYNYDAELNIDYSVKFYLNQGADRDKLVLGIPTYGRTYTLINEETTEIGAPAEGPGEQGDATREKGYLAYYEICQNIKEDPEWTVVQPNPNALGPYAFRRNQWVGYDDEAIVRKKSQYVVDNGLGGIMFWAIDNDDFRGTCTGKPYPLIEAAKEAMLDALGLGINEVSKPSVPQKPSRARSRENTSSTRNRITTSEQKLTYAERKEAGKRVGGLNSRNRVQSTSTTTVAPKDFKLTEVEGSSLYIGGRTTTPPPPTTPDPGTDFKCEEEGFFQHPRDCKKYYWCLDSGPSGLGIVAHQFTCPSGLYFNPAADSCDFARNVPCKTKKSTTAAPITTSGTTRTPVTVARPTSSLNRIAGATIRNNLFRTTTTTTTTTENPEYEYEEEEEEDSHPSPFAKQRQHAEKEAEEDPKVIKELIELIRKLGGVEELEKHLLRKDDGTISIKETTSTGSSGSQLPTTPPTISKSLYDKVLSKPNALNSIRNNFRSTSSFRTTAQTKATQTGSDTGTDEELDSQESDTKNSGNSKYSSVVRGSNSRQGPQNEGLDKLSEFDGFLKEKKQYITINRNRGRSSTVQEQEDVEEEEEEVKSKENNEEAIEVSKSSRKPSTATTYTYTSIKRTRPATTATSTVEEEEAEKEVTEKKQYNTLSRSRVRGSTTANSEAEVTDVTNVTNGSNRYKYLERSRPARPTTESSPAVGANDEEDEEDQDNTVHTQAVNSENTRDTHETTITTTTNTNTQKSYASIGRRITTTTASPDIETETATTTAAILTTTTSPTTFVSSTTETPITSRSSSNVDTTTPESIVTSHTTTTTPTPTPTPTPTTTPTVIPTTTTTTNPDTPSTTTTTLSPDVPTTTPHPNDILDIDSETLDLSLKINSLMSDSSLIPTLESGLDTNKQESDSLTTTITTSTATEALATSTSEAASTDKTNTTTTTKDEGDHKDENEVNVVIKERKKTVYTPRTRTTATPSTTPTSEVESNPTSSLTNTYKLNGVRRQQILLNRSSQTKATTSTIEHTPTTETVNSEFLGTVSSPRPFGFPKKRTRPTATTTTTGSTSTTTTTEDTLDNSSVSKANRFKAAANSQIKKVSSDSLLSVSESESQSQNESENATEYELTSSQREHGHESEVEHSTKHSLGSLDSHGQHLQQEHVNGQVVGIKGNLDLRHDNTQKTSLRTHTIVEEVNDDDGNADTIRYSWRDPRRPTKPTPKSTKIVVTEITTEERLHQQITPDHVGQVNDINANANANANANEKVEKHEETTTHTGKYRGKSLENVKTEEALDDNAVESGRGFKQYTTIHRQRTQGKESVEQASDSAKNTINGFNVTEILKSSGTNDDVGESDKTTNVKVSTAKSDGGSKVTTTMTRVTTTTSNASEEQGLGETESAAGLTEKANIYNNLGDKTKSYTTVNRIHTATTSADNLETNKGIVESEDSKMGTTNNNKSYTTIERVHTATQFGESEGKNDENESSEQDSYALGINKKYNTIKRIHTTTTTTKDLDNGNDGSAEGALGSQNSNENIANKTTSYSTVKRVHSVSESGQTEDAENATLAVKGSDSGSKYKYKILKRVYPSTTTTFNDTTVKGQTETGGTSRNESTSYTTVNRIHSDKKVSSEDNNATSGSKSRYNTIQRIQTTSTTSEEAGGENKTGVSQTVDSGEESKNKLKSYSALNRIHSASESETEQTENNAVEESSLKEGSKGKYGTTKRVHTTVTTTSLSGDELGDIYASDKEDGTVKTTAGSRLKAYTNIKRVPTTSGSNSSSDSEDSQKILESLEEHDAASESNLKTVGNVKNVKVTTTTTEVSADDDDGSKSGTNSRTYTTVKRIRNKNIQNESDKSESDSSTGSTLIRAKEINNLATENSSRYGSAGKSTEKKTYTTITRHRSSSNSDESSDNHDSDSNSARTRTSYLTTTENIPYKAIVRDDSGVHLSEEELSGFVKTTVNTTTTTIAANVESENIAPSRVISRGGQIIETQERKTDTTTLNEGDEELIAEIEDETTDGDVETSTIAPTTSSTTTESTLIGGIELTTSTATEQPTTTVKVVTEGTTTPKPSTVDITTSSAREEPSTTVEVVTEATTTPTPSTVETTRRLLFQKKTTTTTTQAPSTIKRKYTFKSKQNSQEEENEGEVKENITTQTFQRRTSFKQRPVTSTTTVTTATEVRHEASAGDSDVSNSATRGLYRPVDLAKKQGTANQQQQFGNGRRRVFVQKTQNKTEELSDTSNGSATGETTSRTETVNGRRRTIITRKKLVSSAAANATQTNGQRLKGETGSLSEVSSESENGDVNVTRGTYRPAEKGELSSLLANDLAKKHVKQTETTYGNGKFRRPVGKSTTVITEQVETTKYGADAGLNTTSKHTSTETEVGNGVKKIIRIHKRINTTLVENETETSGTGAHLKNSSEVDLNTNHTVNSATKTEAANGLIVTEKIVVTNNSTLANNGGESVTITKEETITTTENENISEDNEKNKKNSSSATKESSNETIDASKSATDIEKAATFGQTSENSQTNKSTVTSSRRLSQNSGNRNRFNSQTRTSALGRNRATTVHQEDDTSAKSVRTRVQGASTTKLRLQSQLNNSQGNDVNTGSRRTTTTTTSRRNGIQRSQDSGKTEKIDYLEDGSKRIITTTTESFPTGTNTIKTIRRIKTKIIKKQDAIYEDDDEAVDNGPTTRRPATHSRGSVKFQSNDLSSLLALDLAQKASRKSQGEPLGQKPRRKIIRRPDIVTETEEVEEFETELSSSSPTTTNVTEVTETKTINGKTGPSQRTKTIVTKDGSATTSEDTDQQHEVVKSNVLRRNFGVKRPTGSTSTTTTTTTTVTSPSTETVTPMSAEEESSAKRNFTSKRPTTTRKIVTVIKPKQALSNQTVVKDETATVERTKVLNKYSFKNPAKQNSTTVHSTTTTEESKEEVEEFETELSSSSPTTTNVTEVTESKTINGKTGPSQRTKTIVTKDGSATTSEVTDQQHEVVKSNVLRRNFGVKRPTGSTSTTTTTTTTVTSPNTEAVTQVSAEEESSAKRNFTINRPTTTRKIVTVIKPKQALSNQTVVKDETATVERTKVLNKYSFKNPAKQNSTTVHSTTTTEESKEEVEEFETELSSSSPTTTNVTEVTESKTINGKTGPSQRTKTIVTKDGSATTSEVTDQQHEVVKSNVLRRNFGVKRPTGSTSTTTTTTTTVTSPNTEAVTQVSAEEESSAKRNFTINRPTTTRKIVTVIKPKQALSNQTVVKDETATVERTKVLNKYSFKNPAKQNSTTVHSTTTTEESISKPVTTTTVITKETTTTTGNIPATTKTTTIVNSDGVNNLNNQLALDVNKLTTETTITTTVVNHTSEAVPSNGSTPGTEDLSLPIYHRRKYYQYYKDSPITYVSPTSSEKDSSVASSQVNVAQQIHDVFNVSTDNISSGETSVDGELTELDSDKAKEINNGLSHFLLKTPGSN